jgi:hypothetical protein
MGGFCANIWPLERVIRMNEKPPLDQFYPGGVAQQSLDWNLQQHDAIAGGAGSLIGPTGP